MYPNYTYPPDPGSRGAPPACHQPPRQTRPLARRTRRPRAGGHHPGTDRMTPHSLPPTTQPSAEQCQVPRTHSVNCHDQQCLYCRYVIECYLCVIRRALNSFTKPSRSIGRLMAHSVGLHFRHFRISVRWGEVNMDRPVHAAGLPATGASCHLPVLAARAVRMDNTARDSVPEGDRALLGV